MRSDDLELAYLANTEPVTFASPAPPAASSVGVVDDEPCPECPGLTGADHGTADQAPFHTVFSDGYVHEWHADCLRD